MFIICYCPQKTQTKQIMKIILCSVHYGIEKMALFIAYVHVFCFPSSSLHCVKLLALNNFMNTKYFWGETFPLDKTQGNFKNTFVGTQQQHHFPYGSADTLTCLSHHILISFFLCFPVLHFVIQILSGTLDKFSISCYNTSKNALLF